MPSWRPGMCVDLIPDLRTKFTLIARLKGTCTSRGRVHNPACRSVGRRSCAPGGRSAPERERTVVVMLAMQGDTPSSGAASGADSPDGDSGAEDGGAAFDRSALGKRLGKRRPGLGRGGAKAPEPPAPKGSPSKDDKKPKKKVGFLEVGAFHLSFISGADALCSCACLHRFRAWLSAQCLGNLQLCPVVLLKACRHILLHFRTPRATAVVSLHVSNQAARTWDDAKGKVKDLDFSAVPNDGSAADAPGAGRALELGQSLVDAADDVSSDESSEVRPTAGGRVTSHKVFASCLEDAAVAEPDQRCPWRSW